MSSKVYYIAYDKRKHVQSLRSGFAQGFCQHLYFGPLTFLIFVRRILRHMGAPSCILVADTNHTMVDMLDLVSDFTESLHHGTIFSGVRDVRPRVSEHFQPNVENELLSKGISGKSYFWPVFLVRFIPVQKGKAVPYQSYKNLQTWKAFPSM